MTVEARFELIRGEFVLNAGFSVPAQGITILTGPSGSGKTSLLRCLAGFERSRGSCSVGGRIWQSAEVFVPAYRRSIGTVFQDGGLFPHLSVLENLKLAAEKPDQKLLDELRLSSLLGRSPETLSGGERRRVALGRALLRKPDLLLMDEPLTGLDIEAKREILPLIREASVSRRIPIFYVSHSLTEILALGDHLLTLRAGSAVKSESLNALKPRLQEMLDLEKSIGVDLFG